MKPMKKMKQTKQIKAGLLPLYIKLYDDSSPEMRVKIDAFHKLISDKLSGQGISLIDVPGRS